MNNKLFELTKCSKLKWFQFRIIHRILGTNALLFKMGIKESALCDMCHAELETISHIFTECTVTNQFWQQLFHWFRTIFDIPLNPEKHEILFGIDNDTYFVRITILLGKFHIFKRKLDRKRPNLDVFKNELITYHNVEKYNLCSKKQNSLYEYRWIPYS